MATKLEDYVRLIFALVFLGVFSYLIVTGREISSNLTQVLLIAVGFYFGVDRVGDVVSKIYKDKKNGGSNNVTGSDTRIN